MRLKVVDLSRTIEQGMPLSTRVPKRYVRIRPREVVLPDNFAVTKWEGNLMTIDSHTGTHVDAPRCIRRGGMTIDVLPPERFTMTPTLRLDYRIKATFTNPVERVITREDIEPYSDRLKDVKAVLIWTGFDQYYGRDLYSKEHPYLSYSAAEYLISIGIAVIGVDTAGLENPEIYEHFDRHHRPIHAVLFDNDVLIIENLTDLEKLPEESFHLIWLPLKIKDGTGGMARVVGVIDIVNDCVS